MNKEQTKKIILGAFGVIGLLYVYFVFFLGPLNKSRYSMAGRMAEFQNKVASSKTEIANVTKLETNARAATARYDALMALYPEGAPIAWFPPRIRVFFSNQQIDKSSARLEGTAGFTEKELSSWNKYRASRSPPSGSTRPLARSAGPLRRWKIPSLCCQ